MLLRDGNHQGGGFGIARFTMSNTQTITEGAIAPSLSSRPSRRRQQHR
jgi:hypothetical protein